jgi:hypothetical protein
VKFSLEIKDGAAVVRKLKKLESKVQKKLAITAVRTTLKRNLEPAVKRALPSRTGLLRKLTRTRNTKRTRESFGAMVTNGGKAFKKGKTSGAAFSGRAYYGGMIEYGTQPRQVKFGGFVPFLGVKTENRGSVPAGYYFTKTFKAREKPLLRRMEARLKNGVENFKG